MVALVERRGAVVAAVIAGKVVQRHGGVPGGAAQIVVSVRPGVRCLQRHSKDRRGAHLRHSAVIPRRAFGVHLEFLAGDGAIPYGCVVSVPGCRALRVVDGVSFVSAGAARQVLVGHGPEPDSPALHGGDRQADVAVQAPLDGGGGLYGVRIAELLRGIELAEQRGGQGAGSGGGQHLGNAGSPTALGVNW